MTDDPKKPNWRGRIVLAVMMGFGLLRLFEAWVNNGGRLK